MARQPAGRRLGTGAVGLTLEQDGARLRIEAFAPVPRGAHEEIEAETERLTAFLAPDAANRTIDIVAR